MSQTETRANGIGAEKQLTIEGYLTEIEAKQRGQTCTEEDTPRLNAQCLRVYAFMRDLRSHELKEIAKGTGDPEASVSARIREIRNYLKRGNKGTILTERVEGGNGLHHYTMRLNKYFGAA